MRQGAAQSAPTSLHEWDNCMLMLIIVNRILFSYYSSLYKISYIPAQLFRASMKVLHSICNIFASQMKKQMLADDRGD